MLAPCWACKPNTVSPQELKGGSNKTIFQLISVDTFFFPCLFEICMGSLENKRMGGLRGHKEACRTSPYCPAQQRWAVAGAPLGFALPNDLLQAFSLMGQHDNTGCFLEFLHLWVGGNK